MGERAMCRKRLHEWVPENIMYVTIRGNRVPTCRICKYQTKNKNWKPKPVPSLCRAGLHPWPESAYSSPDGVRRYCAPCRQVRKRKTAKCWNGHPFTDENTRYYEGKDGRRQRLCTICEKRRHERRRKRNTAHTETPCSTDSAVQLCRDELAAHLERKAAGKVSVYPVFFGPIGRKAAA